MWSRPFRFPQRSFGRIKITAVILGALLSGCVSHHVAVPPANVTIAVDSSKNPGEDSFIAALARSSLGTESLIGQIVLGCGHFYDKYGRWPDTKEEVAAGLANANLSASKLANLERIDLQEEGGAIIIDFTSTENGRMHGTIKLHIQPDKP